MSAAVPIAGRAQRGALLIRAVPVLVGSVMFPINRYVVTHRFLPLAFLAPRFAVATLIFVVLAALRQWPWQMSRSDAVRVAVFGGTSICINQISLVLATRYTTATTVALFFGTYPVCVALLAQVLGAKDATRRTLLATLVSTAGVSIVVAGRGGSVSISTLGVLLSLLTPLSLASYTVTMAPVLQRRSALQVNAIACLVATPPLFAVAARELGRQDWSAVTALDWAGFAYASLVAMIGGFGVMLIAVRLVGPTKMSLLMNLQPFLGVLFSVLLLSETITRLQLVGGAVIAVSIALAWRRPAAPVAVVPVEPAGATALEE